MPPRRSVRRNNIAYRKGDYVEVSRRELHSFSFSFTDSQVVGFSVIFDHRAEWHALSRSQYHSIMYVVNGIYYISFVEPLGFFLSPLWAAVACVLCANYSLFVSPVKHHILHAISPSINTRAVRSLVSLCSESRMELMTNLLGL